MNQLNQFTARVKRNLKKHQREGEGNKEKDRGNEEQIEEEEKLRWRGGCKI